MKKFLSMAAIAAAVAFSFTSCINDDDDSSDGSKNYTGFVSNAYVVNAGLWGSGNGSLSRIAATASYSAGTVTFAASDLVALGELPNDILFYGNRLYIVGTGTNKIYVYDKSTMRSIAQVSTTELMGETAGQQPRNIKIVGANMYVTTYGVSADSGYPMDAVGYVAAIDTLNFQLQAQYPVGAYPEDIEASGTLSNFNLYVANSDYGRGNGSISIINIVSGSTPTTTTKTFEGIENPTKFAISGYYMYILDFATYSDVDHSKLTNSTVYQWQGVTYTPTKVIEADMMAPITFSSGTSTVSRLYYVNDIYGTPKYGYYDLSSGNTTMSVTGITKPSAIGVNPYTGYVYIAATDGTTNVYSYDGTLIQSGLSIGSYPTAFAFDFKYTTSTSTQWQY